MTILLRSSQLLAVAVATVLIGGVADAGRGGSAARIRNAIQTTSTDAIIAELERAERLICDACTAPVLDLLDDERAEVREVAAWWFARRPVMKAMLTERSIADLAGSDARLARNAADVLGTFRHPIAIEALAAAARRADLAAEARRHAVRALGTIGHRDANEALARAMADADPGVRREALEAWAAIRGQAGAEPAVARVTDPDASVRALAAAVIGEVRDPAGRAALEAQLATEADPVVRRNAAWALGRIGDRTSRPALEAAADDASPLVRMTARAALRQLR
jgi:HEAT repeat protein